MAKAYGFIESKGVVTSTVLLDTVCKAADVRLAGIQRRMGGQLVTIIIEGRVADVQEAVEASKANGALSTGVIARPHPEIVRLVGSLKNAENKEEGGNKNGTGSTGNDRDKGSDSSD